jgi:hypothetical protein
VRLLDRPSRRPSASASASVIRAAPSVPERADWRVCLVRLWRGAGPRPSAQGLCWIRYVYPANRPSPDEGFRRRNPPPVRPRLRPCDSAGLADPGQRPAWARRSPAVRHAGPGRDALASAQRAPLRARFWARFVLPNAPDREGSGVDVPMGPTPPIGTSIAPTRLVASRDGRISGSKRVKTTFHSDTPDVIKIMKDHARMACAKSEPYPLAVSSGSGMRRAPAPGRGGRTAP